MESRNEKHMSMEQIMRLVSTVRFLMAHGRTEEQIAMDLMQSHGLTAMDFRSLMRLAA